MTLQFSSLLKGPLIIGVVGWGELFYINFLQLHFPQMVQHLSWQPSVHTSQQTSVIRSLPLSVVSIVVDAEK